MRDTWRSRHCSLAVLFLPSYILPLLPLILFQRKQLAEFVWIGSYPSKNQRRCA